MSMGLGLGGGAVGGGGSLRLPLRGTIRPIKMGCLGDSYGAGTGSTYPYSCMDIVAADLRARYGDAGAGYIPITNGVGTVLAITLASTPAQYGPWSDPRRALAACGMGLSRTGGAGATDTTNYATFGPALTDNYNRNVQDTIVDARVFFTPRSTAPRPGFVMHSNTITAQDYRAKVISAGADFTGSISGTTLTASSVTGLIPRGGSLIKGGTTAAGTVTANAAGTTTGTLEGGAGTYPVSISQTVTSAAMTADTILTNPLDTMQTAGFRAVTGSNNNIFFTHISGDVLLHGVEYFNGQKGITFCNLSLGGISAHQLATLDDTAQRTFWKLLDLDLLFIMLGHNGKIYLGPDYFAADMETLISRVQSCSRTEIILIRQCDASDSAGSYHPQYDGVYQTLAEAYGCGYYDQRTASPSLANYALASAAGLMEADGTHVNSAGNTIIGHDLASKITLPVFS
jgi:lysophospholipase L1-like esterase